MSLKIYHQKLLHYGGEKGLKDQIIDSITFAKDKVATLQKKIDSIKHDAKDIKTVKEFEAFINLLPDGGYYLKECRFKKSKEGLSFKNDIEALSLEQAFNFFVADEQRSIKASPSDFVNEIYNYFSTLPEGILYEVKVKEKTLPFYIKKTTIYVDKKSMDKFLMHNIFKIKKMEDDDYIKQCILNLLYNSFTIEVTYKSFMSKLTKKIKL